MQLCKKQNNIPEQFQNSENLLQLLQLLLVWKIEGDKKQKFVSTWSNSYFTSTLTISSSSIRSKAQHTQQSHSYEGTSTTAVAEHLHILSLADTVFGQSNTSYTTKKINSTEHLHIFCSYMGATLVSG